MNDVCDTMERSPRTLANSRPQPAHAAHPSAPNTEPTAWQTPGYTVIETALEVTAYALTAR